MKRRFKVNDEVIIVINDNPLLWTIDDLDFKNKLYKFVRYNMYDNKLSVIRLENSKDEIPIHTEVLCSYKEYVWNEEIKQIINEE